MIDVQGKPCHRCGGTAKAGVVIARDKKHKGEAYPLCDDCLTVVQSVIDHPTAAAMAKDNDRIIEFDWVDE